MKIIAFFNHKIKLGIEGRSKTFKTLESNISKTDQTIWFHCASLGEYEQGLPVFKEIRKMYSNHKIVLSLFSPSGYEIRKNTDVADIVVYLPMDTKANAQRFLKLVHPQLTIFVKYDIWPNYLLELKKRHLRAILISALFRKNQSYFKWYGSLMRKSLSAFNHIFVQDEASKLLLKTNGFHQVSISGDTRFDRVFDQLSQDNSLQFLDAFKEDKLCVVIGSSWPEDEKLLIPYLNESTSDGIKFIIAPHNMKSNQINDLMLCLKRNTVMYSEMEGKNLSEYSVFILDTIGILSKTYSYADIAFVGGAVGTTGMHNILEPAVFGVPIIIGRNHHKFPEAKQMIEQAGVLSISNYDELKTTMDNLISQDSKRKELGELNGQYIVDHRGAVDQIMDFIRI